MYIYTLFVSAINLILILMDGMLEFIKKIVYEMYIKGGGLNLNPKNYFQNIFFLFSLI